MASWPVTDWALGRQVKPESSRIFRPVLDDGRVRGWAKLTENHMRNTGQDLRKIMGATRFDLSESLEEVYERVAPGQNEVAWKGRAFRVKLQRKY